MGATTDNDRRSACRAGRCGRQCAQQHYWRAAPAAPTSAQKTGRSWPWEAGNGLKKVENRSVAEILLLIVSAARRKFSQLLLIGLPLRRAKFAEGGRHPATGPVVVTTHFRQLIFSAGAPPLLMR
jgi:hypothetical protein